MSQAAPAPPPGPVSTGLRKIVRLAIAFGAVALAAAMMIGLGEEQAQRLHHEKYIAVLALLEQEVAKRPLERDYVAPVSPAEIAALMEQDPVQPLENKGYYLEERYSFQRGVPLATLDLIVFYKPTPDGPRLYSVADQEAARRLTQPLP
jgi:hypothetical protein